MTREQLSAQWLIMEDLQDSYPYFYLGWYGFVPMVVWA